MAGVGRIHSTVTSDDVLRSKYRQLTAPDEAVHWYTVDSESSQGADIEMLKQKHLSAQ
jgi:hypothetical protein